MPLFVIPFPTMDPVLIDIGPFAIRWYALAYIAGILIAWFYMRRLLITERLWTSPAGRRKQVYTAPGVTPTDIDDFIVWGTIGIVVGGRLGYVLFYNFDYYLANPVEALEPWKRGMSFHGGFIGTVVAMLLFARLRKISIWTLFDLAACSAPIGLFFGRLANFVNGELWGRPTDVPWAMVFPGAGPFPRHPSQLYEAGLEGLALFAILLALTYRGRMLRHRGFMAGAFVCGYGIARTFCEFFRMPDIQIGFLAGGLTMGMALSVPMIIVGAAVMIWARRRSKALDLKNADATSAQSASKVETE